jgi:hypothetical protein
VPCQELQSGRGGAIWVAVAADEICGGRDCGGPGLSRFTAACRCCRRHVMSCSDLLRGRSDTAGGLPTLNVCNVIGDPSAGPNVLGAEPEHPPVAKSFSSHAAKWCSFFGRQQLVQSCLHAPEGLGGRWRDDQGVGGSLKGEVVCKSTMLSGLSRMRALNIVSTSRTVFGFCPTFLRCSRVASA